MFCTESKPFFFFLSGRYRDAVFKVWLGLGTKQLYVLP